MDISIEKSGPVFDGRADRAYREFTRKSDNELGDAAEKLVLQNLNTSIRRNFHVYTSTIHSTSSGALSHTVHDGGHPSVYGPWLEGTGSRNRTTRFKGYFSFRRAVQELESRAESIVQRVLDRYIERMN